MSSGWNKPQKSKPPKPPAAPPSSVLMRARKIAAMDAEDIRLMFGELTASEVRLVRAVASNIANAN